jgi:hypothetical protein
VAGTLPQCRHHTDVETVSFVRGVSSRNALVTGEVREGWWSIAEDDGGPGRIVAGPFPDRAEAGWAGAVQVDGGSDAVRPVYGVLRADGTLGRRPSPQDWEWLAHLAEQLERLPDDWDLELSEDDPLGTLAVEVTAALAEAGLPVHDATGAGSAHGGACLIPEPALGGLVVTWRQHDRMSLDQAHGATVDAQVQQAMNRMLGEVLALRGFGVDAFGEGTGHVVRRAAGE